MQKAANIMGVLITAFVLFGALIVGCGTEDPLEQNNLRYQTDVSFSDHGEDDILTVDIARTWDCDEDGVADDPEDGLTDLFATITIAIEDATTPGLEMTGYEITFHPLREYDQSDADNADVPPPVGSYRGAYDAVIPSESEFTFTITCMEYDQKVYMASFLNLTNYVFRYRVEITMEFVDEYNEEREITVERTLYFGEYNNC